MSTMDTDTPVMSSVHAIVGRRLLEASTSKGKGGDSKGGKGGKGGKGKSPETVASVNSFVPRDGDVYISTMAKTGTTWLQMICHQLRSPGDTSFEEICTVVPWLECMHECGQDLDGDQPGSPRAFKTHQLPSRLPDPRGTAKFLCTIRNPHKKIVSHFKFIHAKGKSDTDDINEWLANSAGHALTSMFEGYVEYWLCRELESVLLLCFEDMQADLRKAVLQVAALMGMQPSDSVLDTVCDLSSFRWMSAHDTQFDDHWMYALLGQSDHIVSKVGLKNDKVQCELSEQSMALIDQQWAEIVESRTGLANYAAMRAELNRST